MEQVPVKEITLEMQRFAIQRIVDITHIPKENLKLESFPFMECCNGMGVRLSAYIWGENMDTREYPKGWWDAFKLRWYPRWLLRRFPPTMTRLNVIGFYPQLAFTDRPAKVKIMKLDNIQWGE